MEGFGPPLNQFEKSVSFSQVVNITGREGGKGRVDGGAGTDQFTFRRCVLPILEYLIFFPV